MARTDCRSVRGGRIGRCRRIPATALFVKARREQGRRLFSPRELVVLAVSAAGAVLGVVALAVGWISL